MGGVSAGLGGLGMQGKEPSEEPHKTKWVEPTWESELRARLVVLISQEPTQEELGHFIAYVEERRALLTHKTDLERIHAALDALRNAQSVKKAKQRAAYLLEALKALE